ncbi:MAG TPA: DUF1573 domain-containing protein [Bacteroidales bacterium]|nr:DUF1573 domain-containing protein [Bacteroidales bacterium]
MKIEKNILVNYSIVILLLIVVSCTENKVKTTQVQAQKGYPRIAFDTTFHDFGNLIQGEKAAFTFKFKNTGQGELVINDVFSSCGCTVPNFSKDPVKNGDEGKIEIIFDSEGRNGSQYKSITVKTNATVPEKTLIIKANVIVN